MSALLPLLILMPLLGGLILLLARRGSLHETVSENVSTLIALGSLALSVLLVFSVANLPSPGADEMQASATDAAGAPPRDANAAPTVAPTIVPKIEFAPDWFRLRLPANASISPDGWQLRLGLDGIGAIMVLLTTLVTSCVLVVARSTIERNRSDFAAWLLIATGCMLLVFMSMDMLLFYVGFELVLIPLFVLIAGWGDKDATSAAKRFVLYTLAGSIPMVLALLGISALYGTEKEWLIGFSELSQRAAETVGQSDQAFKQTWIFALLVLGLGIKTAVLPLHTWLPTTYGAAHPTCSAFLAAVVLKLGLFGFMRLALPLVPNAVSSYGAVILGTLGAVAIVYGAMAALAQTDLRLLMAYSSLSHVGFITLGMFALNVEGLAGATLQMFNHGLTTAAMFLLMACLVVRRGSTRWDEGSRGLAGHYPRLAFFLVFFVVAGAGTPGLNNFVGELLALTAMISVHPVLTCIGVLGVVLGAWYAFRMTQHILFGKYDAGKRSEMPGQLQSNDLGFDQKAVFVPLAVLSILIGVVPLIAINIFRADVERIAKVNTEARQAMAEAATAEQVSMRTVER
ncbi:MAG: NADH-quinone oxidoreductase subunit M [Pirellulaceae bacterium]|nr:NADH-quinone oxidoreductase subunit M [Pirellulaceae bacterium]